MAKKSKNTARRKKRFRDRYGLTFFSKKGWFKSWVAIPIIGLIIVTGYVIIHFSLASVSPQGTYANWNWSPPTTGFNSLQYSLSVQDADPTSYYFWSHQFQFIGGDGGYMGLQTRGNRADGTVGKSVVFSIFSAGIAATPGACKVQQAGFDGYNTSGSSCIVAYDWQIGRSYTLRTSKLNSESDGSWWGGYIKDNTSGTESFIAQIKVPPTWLGTGGWSVMWTENYGPQPPSCDAIAYSKVLFSTPSANNGTTVPVSNSNSLSTSSSCNNSRITSVPGGVIQEIGNPAPPVVDPPIVNDPKPPRAIVGVVGERISPANQSSICNNKVTKLDGTTVCKLSKSYPVFRLRNLGGVPFNGTQFCFTVGKPATIQLSYIISIGNDVATTGNSITVNTTPGKTIENFCIPARGYMNSTTGNNFASITLKDSQTTTNISPLVYSGYYW